MDEQNQGAIENGATEKQVVDSTPVETANEAPAGAMSETPAQPAETTGATGKKKKTGLIIGAAVAVAAVVGGGVYAYIHNTPEKVQYDAIAGFLSADHIQVAGTVKVLPDKDSGAGLNSLELELKEAAVANLNYDVEATIKASVEGLDDTISISLGGAFIEDGTIYIKVSNLKEALTTVMEATGAEYDYDSLDTMTDGLLGEIDGQWWKIAVDEVVDNLDDEIVDRKTKSKVKKGWGCIMETLKAEGSERDKYAKLYKENSFVTTTKTTGNLENHAGISTSAFEKAGDIYDVKIDADKLAGFLNGTVKAANADMLFTCLVDAEIVTEDEVEDAKSDISKGEVKTSDIAEVVEKLPNVKVAISGWNHNLSGVYVDYSGSVGSATGALTMSYDKSKKVSAPSDAKSVTELVNKAMTLVETFSATNGSDVIDYDYDDDDLYDL